MRIYFPKNRFSIEPKRTCCVLTGTVSLRVGRLVKALAGNKLEVGLSCVKKHMKEEGENLKSILEEEGSLHNNAIHNER